LSNLDGDPGDAAGQPASLAGRGADSNITVGLQRRVSINEGLTLLVAAGSLLVAILTYANARDTSDLKSAVKHLDDLANAEAALAKTTTGELAAMNAQVAQLSRQADVADDARRREFRPYVSTAANIELAGTSSPPLLAIGLGPTGPTGTVTFITSGKAPTIDARLRAGTFFAANGFAGGTVPALQIPIPGNLGGDGDEKTLHIGSARADPEGAKLFNQGARVAVMAGELDYFDPFQRPHHTRFCYYVTRLGEEPIACQRGNFSD
jgi:hypothetical protein